MIKYRIYLLIFACALFVNFTTVNAANACTNSVKKELSQIAAHVKVNYEIKDFSEEKELEIDGKKTIYKVPNYIFEISVYNITEDIYVLIEKTDTKKLSKTPVKTVYASDAEDGIYTFTDSNIGDIYNYHVTVKSNKDACIGSSLRTMKFTKPRYNAYSEFTYCHNSSNYYCQRFIGTEIDIKDNTDFLNKIKVNNEKNNPSRDDIEDKEAIKNLLKDNWKMYVLIFVIILGLIVGGVFFIKKHREKKGWKL